jgi:dihydroxyacid dehydratase/phosphogluconate dehydratase
VPDLVVVQPGGKVHFIELKSKGGTLSKVQKAIRDRLHSMSVDCITVGSIDEVRIALGEWKIPTREVTS